MKSARHGSIREIIEQGNIETQEELAEALRKRNIDVTQATVSRDIKELMLVKVPTGNGHSRYALPERKTPLFNEEQMARLFREFVTSLNASENILVIKTLPGAAGIVATAMDHAEWPEIIGTVAGDDTLLAVVKPMEMAGDVMEKLRVLMHRQAEAPSNTSTG